MAAEEKTKNPKGAGRKRKMSPEQESHIYKLYTAYSQKK